MDEVTLLISLEKIIKQTAYSLDLMDLENWTTKLVISRYTIFMLYLLCNINIA